MRRHLPFAALCVLLLVQTGCGAYLGDYRLEGVRRTSDISATLDGHEPGYGDYFEIELSSEIDLTQVENSGLYADADFCPIRGRSGGFVAFGPASEDGPLVDHIERLSPRADGRFPYRVFIVAAHPMPGVNYSASWTDQKTYDLRKAARDVCIRFHSPGYTLTLSKSGIVRVPARRFREAQPASSAHPSPRSGSQAPRAER